MRQQQPPWQQQLLWQSVHHQQQQSAAWPATQPGTGASMLPYGTPMAYSNPQRGSQPGSGAMNLASLQQALQQQLSPQLHHQQMHNTHYMPTQTLPSSLPSTSILSNTGLQGMCITAGPPPGPAYGMAGMPPNHGQLPLAQAVMAVPETQVGAVIGHGGAMLQQLKLMFNCKVVVADRTLTCPVTRTRKVYINGAPDAVVMVQQVLAQKLAEHALANR